MDVFTIEDNIVKPTAEILLVFPFDEIWSRDASAHKELALKEFGYINGMTSPKKTNLFYGYPVEDQHTHAPVRHNKILEAIFKYIPDWEPDELIQEGIIFLTDHFKEASPSLAYYEANVQALDKVRASLLDLDMTEKNARGMYMHTTKSVTDGIKNCDEVLSKLNNSKEKVEQELYDNAKTKGNRRINPFEV